MPDEPADKERAADGTRDAELDAMIKEAPLLDLIRKDTGEQGHESGGRIDFHTCPVCGHHDDFSYYHGQNTWACLSASNTTGITGGSFLDYAIATGRATDTAGAVRMLREVTGHALDHADEKQTRQADFTPPWVPACASNPPSLQPPLVDNLIRQGHIALMSGKGKSGKTFSAIELALALAVGGEWFGHACAKGRTLFIDPECKPEEFHDRLEKVCGAMGIDTRIADASIDYWNLRGQTSKTKMPQIIGAISAAGTDAALIVIDSVSMFVEGDENSSVDVRRLNDLVNDLSMQTDAAILLIHHYGKGSAGDRAATDRARGSSVWLDAPDHVFTLTEIHPPSGEASDYLGGDGNTALAFEVVGQRTFKMEKPTHIIWKYPTHRVDAEGVTTEWKPKSAQRTGGKSTAEVNRAKSEKDSTELVLKLLQHFYLNNIGSEGVLFADAARAIETSAPTLKKAIEACGSDYFTIHKPSPRKTVIVPTHTPLMLEHVGRSVY